MQDTVLATTAAVGSAGGIATGFNNAAGRNTSAISDDQRTSMSPDTSLLTSGAKFGATPGDTSNQGLNPISSEAVNFMEQDPSSQKTLLDGIKNQFATASLAASMAFGSAAGATDTSALSAPTAITAVSQAPATEVDTGTNFVAPNTVAINAAPTTSQNAATETQAATQTAATTNAANTVASDASTSVSNSLKAGADANTAITTAINSTAKADGNVNSVVAPTVTTAINAGVNAASAISAVVTASANAGANINNALTSVVDAAIKAGTPATVAIDSAVQAAVANGMTVADATSVAVQAATTAKTPATTNVADAATVAPATSLTATSAVNPANVATNAATPATVATPTAVAPTTTTISPLSATTPTTVAIAPTTTVNTPVTVNSPLSTVTPPVTVERPPVVTQLPTAVTPPTVVTPPPVVTIPPTVATTPTVKTPTVTTPTTTTRSGGLPSGGFTDPKLDSSPQFLAGAGKEKIMQLAALRQIFNSLTPEMQEVLAERGIKPPEAKKETEKESKKSEEKTYEEQLADEMGATPAQIAALFNTKFSASGGTITDTFNPNLKTISSILAAAPVTEGPLKLSGLKHLLQGVSKAPRSMSGYAHGGLPDKYAKAAPKGHNPEFITGLTGYYASGGGTGQSDDIPAMLHDGDYVIDADAVAALGDGSSKAGAQVLSKFQSNVPHSKSSGGSAVPAKIADGEYVFPEAFVTAIGSGDNKQGAKLLDAMREELRAHKRSAPTSKIPPKAKSPLDYLRMAKG